MDEEKYNVHLEMRNLKQTELLRLKNRGKKLRIRREKDRARRRTKKVLEEKVIRNRRPPETAAGHTQKIEVRR